MSPATTGDTENGRSISVTSRVRPGKRKRAIVQAAASPKTRLASTATGTTISVSTRAARVSGSPTRALPYAARPLPSATVKTCTTGTMTRMPTIATAQSVRAQRTHRGSSWARRGVSGFMDTAPALQQVDDNQHREGEAKQDDRDRGRLAVSERFEVLDDQHRGDLRLEALIARDED